MKYSRTSASLVSLVSLPTKMRGPARAFAMAGFSRRFKAAAAESKLRLLLCAAAAAISCCTAAPMSPGIPPANPPAFAYDSRLADTSGGKPCRPTLLLGGRGGNEDGEATIWCCGPPARVSEAAAAAAASELACAPGTPDGDCDCWWCCCCCWTLARLCRAVAAAAADALEWCVGPGCGWEGVCCMPMPMLRPRGAWLARRAWGGRPLGKACCALVRSKAGPSMLGPCLSSDRERSC
mmetsp:Transcript_1939/g.4899  ORF Transcript_1939/g.4899 Transcript_1939/m.4899 type:complete len:237 (-) Transcript_1939:1006-1716(-)